LFFSSYQLGPRGAAAENEKPAKTFLGGHFN
jgi:hypothetical protein